MSSQRVLLALAVAAVVAAAIAVRACEAERRSPPPRDVDSALEHGAGELPEGTVGTEEERRPVLARRTTTRRRVDAGVERIDEAVVSGSLVHVDTGEPVAGVRMEFGSGPYEGPLECLDARQSSRDAFAVGYAESDSQGRFRFRVQPRNGRVAMRVLTRGLYSFWTEVDATPGSHVDAGELEVHAGGGFAGRVVNEQGAGISGAIVVAIRKHLIRRRIAIFHSRKSEDAADAEHVASFARSLQGLRSGRDRPYPMVTRTDASGAFELIGCTANCDYYLGAIADGFGLNASDVLHRSGGAEPTRVDEIVLHEPGSVRVRAQDDRGVALGIDDLGLEMLMWNGGLDHDAPDDRGGVVRHGIAAGPVDVMIRCGSRLAIEKTVTVSAGRTTEIELLIPTGVDVRGRAVDPDAKPIADAEVEIELLRGSPESVFDDGASLTVTTDADGTFEMLDAPDGELRVRVRANGFERQEVQRPTEKLMDVVIVLDRVP